MKDANRQGVTGVGFVGEPSGGVGGQQVAVVFEVDADGVVADEIDDVGWGIG
ncbi:hypothetical protein [Rhodococcus sp. MS16]|uniref:hypothetical protein n=1 Tax=Rhodococcus sp. MS16 TaxID=2579941 RepID=UPI001561DC4B|nr:hypothetical protein [Rhodococcus sp. MS16]